LEHFFPQLALWLGDVRDPRTKAVYPLKVLLLLGVLMLLSHSGSRNHFNDQMRTALELARTLARILGCEVDAVPHLDTLEEVLRRLQPEDLETLHVRLIRRLIRMKALDGWRVGGQFLLAVDGTGLYSFTHRHCEHCIETHHASGAVTFSHKLLVAFIVNAEGYALPIACEFIENATVPYDKQDCETKAFHRLAERIKEHYPQTPFGLLLDALYADQHVMRKSLANGWGFYITFKPSDMPALWAEAQRLRELSPDQKTHCSLPGTQGSRHASWVNDLDYEGMSVGALFQEDRDPAGRVVRAFAHLVACRIDRQNVWGLAAAARLRWRCENEGFNVLKNGGFGLEHVYSHHPTAAKGYVHLMLIAHLVQQLLTRGRLGTVFREAFHTFLVYGEHLLQALKNEALPPNLNPPGQVRLSTA
jgi:hypothetical protein